ARRARGEPCPAEELCAGCPELAEPLRRRIRDLESMEAFIAPLRGPESAVLATPPLAETQSFLPGARPPPPAFAPAGGGPSRLGPYRILEVLGAGGMGLVLRGADPVLERPVAIKVMRPELAARPEVRARFLREARLAAAVNHPHVVSIHHVGEEAGAPFLVMPLLEGESLAGRLKREGRLGVAEVARVGREVAEGLQAAHEKGLVHRDVKPANLWLEGPGGTVKVLDFGLARRHEAEANLTGPGTVLGTPA